MPRDGTFEASFTVGTAVEMGLVDLAMQTVDGTKLPGNASTDRTYNAATLQKLLDRTEAATAELEAQNEGGDDPPMARLPKQLRRVEGLRWQVRAAMRSSRDLHNVASIRSPTWRTTHMSLRAWIRMPRTLTRGPCQGEWGQNGGNSPPGERTSGACETPGAPLLCGGGK